VIRNANLEPVAAEAWIAFQAIVFIKELGLHHIILQGDVLQMIKILKDTYNNWSRNGRLVDDTMIVLLSFL
jgi:hypothetical protein